MAIHGRRMMVCVGVLALPLLACGWGAGHDTVARALAARLPPPWRERLQGETLRRFCADSHCPDSFEPFPAERVGAEALDSLKAQGLAKRYDLHSDTGRAVAFCLLTRAIKERQTDRALLWLACLAHSTADMAACNHDPVVHIATYGWCTDEWAMKLPGGRALSDIKGCLDLGWVKDDVFGRQVDEARLRDNGADAGAALLEVMLYGVRGAEACAPRGPLVLGAAAEWVDTGKREGGERLAAELSTLGVWAAARVLRDFDAALRLAQADMMPAVTPEVLARYEAAMDAFVRTRPLEADRFAQAALAPSAVKGPRLGVIIEPCWRMNEGMFGFADRVLAAQIVSSLRRQGRNAELVDVRRFLEEGGKAGETPQLIIPAQRCASYRTLKVEALDSRLAEFLGAGGKVVWIGGGKPPGALCRGMPAEFMVKGADKAWPVPLKDFRAGTLGTAVGAERQLARSPEGQAGWHWPTGPYAFTPEGVSRGRVVLTWRGAGEEKVVGAAWPKERPSVAYLPTYAVSPYLWTPEAPSLTPLGLELDAAGAEALTAALDALR